MAQLPPYVIGANDRPPYSGYPQTRLPVGSSVAAASASVLTAEQLNEILYILNTYAREDALNRIRQVLYE